MLGCPYCGSDSVRYVGADDGGGDYGDSICDYFYCDNCQQEFEVNCVDVGGDEDFEEENS